MRPSTIAVNNPEQENAAGVDDGGSRIQKNATPGEICWTVAASASYFHFVYDIADTDEIVRDGIEINPSPTIGDAVVATADETICH